MQEKHKEDWFGSRAVARGEGAWDHQGNGALLELSRKSSVACLCARKRAGHAQGPSAHSKVGIARVPSAEGRRQHGAVPGHRVEQDILDTRPAELLGRQ